MEASNKELKREAVLLVHKQGLESITALHANARGWVMSNLSLGATLPPTPSASLQGLRPISLSDLKVGKVHYGRILYGTLIADAFVMTAVATVLQDEQNPSLAVRVAIYNAASSSSSSIASVQKLYPKSTRVVIKEPYLKRAGDGLLAIRVENPANMEKIADGHGATQKNDRDGCVEGPLQLKEKGNSFFAKQDWARAIQYYGECIIRITTEGKEKEGNSSLLLSAYSNRAEARMRLGSYHEALIDSEAALSIDPCHTKSEYRKGRALQGMMRFQEASACLEDLLSRHPELSEVRVFLDTMKSSNVASEMFTGLSEFVLRRGVPPHFTDFVGPVVVRQTEDGRGRGLFASARVRPGELLLASNALAFSAQDVRKLPVEDESISELVRSSLQEELVTELVRKGAESAALLHQIYGLSPCSKDASLDVPSMDTFRTSAKEVPALENGNAVQVDIERIKEIVKCNGFNQEPWMQNFCCAGIWSLSSYINHSCNPNACRFHVGRGLLVHAAADIQAGDEITMPYFNPAFPLEHRRARALVWNFECICKRCQVEKSVESHLQDLNKTFCSLFSKGKKEYLLAMRYNIEFRKSMELMSVCKELSKLYKKIAKRISDLTVLSSTEKKWALTSYSSAFLAQWFRDWGVVDPALFADSFGTAVELMEALRACLPGCPWNYSFMIKLAWLVFSGLCRKTKVPVSYLMEQADSECIRVFGKQTPDVITKLMEKDLDAIPSIFVC